MHFQEMKQPNYHGISPIIIYIVLIIAITLVLNDFILSEYTSGEYNHRFFISGLIIALPIALLLTTIDALIKNPQDANQIAFFRPISIKEFEQTGRTQDYAKKVSDRLEAEEFKVHLEQHNGDFTYLSFEKEKDEPVSGFRNNAFYGSLSLENVSNTRFSGNATILLDDLIVIETGERDDLKNYLDGFLGFKTTQPDKNLTITLLMGLCLAIASVVFSSFIPESIISIPSFYLTEGLASLIYLILGTIHTLKAKDDVYGLGFSVLGMVLCFLMIIVGLGLNYSDFEF